MGLMKRKVKFNETGYSYSTAILCILHFILFMIRLINADWSSKFFQFLLNVQW